MVKMLFLGNFQMGKENKIIEDSIDVLLLEKRILLPLSN